MEHVELAFDLTRRSLLPLFFRVSFAWGCVIRSHAVKNFLQVELVVGVAAKFHRIIKNIFRYAHELALPNGRTEEKKTLDSVSSLKIGRVQFLIAFRSTIDIMMYYMLVGVALRIYIASIRINLPLFMPE